MEAKIIVIRPMIGIHLDCPYCGTEDSWEYDYEITINPEEECPNCKRIFTIPLIAT